MNTIARRLNPIHWAIFAACVLAVDVSLLGLPVLIRFPVVLGFLAIVPGYSLVRCLTLDDQLHVLLLSLAMSIGVDSAISSLALYLGWWSPNGILIVVALITIAAATSDITGPRIRTALERSRARYRVRALLKRETDAADSM